MKKLLIVSISVLALSISAFAVVGTYTQIGALLVDDYSIVIDGEVYEFGDANGETVLPISYNGTTYLPVRAIGEIMDKTVNWDGNSKTITLLDEKTELSAEDFDYLQNEYFSRDYSNMYANVFLIKSFDNSQDVDLFGVFYNLENIAPIDEQFKAYEQSGVSTDEIELLIENHPLKKITTSEINAHLEEYLGLSLDETNKINLDKYTYLSEYNAYYHGHTDTNAITVEFSHGERFGDIVKLYYKDAENDYVMLKQIEDDYFILRNTKDN